MGNKTKHSKRYLAARTSFPVPSPDAVVDASGGRGAWRAKTLAVWGIPWPPPSGWRAKLADLYNAGRTSWSGWEVRAPARSPTSVPKTVMVPPDLRPHERIIYLDKRATAILHANPAKPGARHGRRH